MISECFKIVFAGFSCAHVSKQQHQQQSFERQTA
jgi:hypothetical protein